MDDRNSAGNDGSEDAGMLKKRIADLQAELARTAQELDVQTWGLTKTNDAIKVLYKELEQKNRELQKLDKLKTDFISTVSHELRTPLTTIREGVSQILDAIHGPINDAQREFLSICLEDVDRLKRIIDDLLDIAKLEAGKVKLVKKQFDIVELVHGVVAAFLPKIKSVNLELREKFSSDKIFMYADRDCIIRTFTNLIGNALKFTKTGYIEISVVDTPEYIEACVADTGKGIAESDLPKVFGKFQQFDRVEGGGERGTGLGLSISKSIVELHRGKIRVESTLGEGTRFIFTLPKYTEDRICQEFVADALQEAVKQNEPLVVVMFGARPLGADARAIDSAKLNSVMENLENLVTQSLRQTDIVVKNTRTILAVFPGTDLAQARHIADRILANVYVSKIKMEGEVDIFYEAVSYPEDGNTAELVFAKMSQISPLHKGITDQ